MAKILIHPFSNKIKGGNPKDYPYWKELIELLKDHELIQIGNMSDEKLVEDFRGMMSAKDLAELLESCDTFIAIDSFLPHLAHLIGKKGIVLWGQSDPKHFGYEENMNLTKKKYRAKQFERWDMTPNDPLAFVTAQEVFRCVS